MARQFSQEHLRVRPSSREEAVVNAARDAETLATFKPWADALVSST